MASEEERIKILAEYMQAADDGEGEEEEEDFDVGDDDESDNGEGHDDVNGDDSDDDEFEDTTKEKGKPNDKNYAILSGSMYINEEGRLIYSGTWRMKVPPASTTTTTAATAIDATTTSSTDRDSPTSNGKKKKTKFKLKSKQNMLKQQNDVMKSKLSFFDWIYPLAYTKEDVQKLDDMSSSAQTHSRTLLFDGFVSIVDIGTLGIVSFVLI